MKSTTSVGTRSGRSAWTLVARATLLAVATALAVPLPTAAHQLRGRFESPLPLAAYVGGAAVAVALSFAFVLLRSRAATSVVSGWRGIDAAGFTDAAAPRTRTVTVPRPIRPAVRALGLVAWLWIVVQVLVFGTYSDADVSSLFLWVYGWVGLALVSALIGPVWEWLDPFATLHDLGAHALRSLHVTGWRTSPYPERLSRWPAVLGLLFFVWLELVVPGGTGGRVLALALVAYTVLTLALMAQYGRDTWRANGEVFSVWFGLLGRLAPLALEGSRGPGTVRLRGYARGLVEHRWAWADVFVVAVAVAGTIYDGLSQTEPYFQLFGQPDLLVRTLLLFAFVGLVVLAVGAAGRVSGVAAIGAGLVPVAVGYIAAHYLTYLLLDGQRILVVASDPLGQGANLFGTASFEPAISWLPTALVWILQLGAVVGGHIAGAWAGHAASQGGAAVRAAPVTTGNRPRRRAATPRTAAPLPPARRTSPVSQLALAVLMVALTVTTLVSLGQAVVLD